MQTPCSDRSVEKNLLFRPAAKGDLPAIVRLLTEDPLGARRESVVAMLPDSYAVAFDTISEDANNELVIADLGGAVVGVLQITFIPCMTYRGSWRATVEGVRVDAKFRSRGIGRALIVCAVQRARQRHCRLVQLTTDKARPDAVRFYQALGFTASHEGLKLHLVDGPADNLVGDQEGVAFRLRQSFDLTLRRATIADLETLVLLNADVQSLHADAHPTLFKAAPDPLQIGSAFSALLEKPGAIWALAEFDEPIGYAYAQLQDRPDAWLRPALKVCYVNQLVVAPEARRNGAARQLIDYVATIASAQGYSRMELDVWSFNTEAKHCFAALGFEVFNERMVRK